MSLEQNVVYEVFPEWKDKKTTHENAAYFHRFLEKKNYDCNHHFLGRTTDTDFAKRMEFFLDEIEKRGLDWKKCMRKLKRRCCDLLRYERINNAKTGSEVKKESAEYSDYIALFGSIAKQNLSEFQAKPEDSETLPSIIKEEKVDSSCS